MDENTKIKTYWKPRDCDYFVEHELTLKVAREYQCDYVKDIEKGSTMIVKDYNLGNKGTLIIIANVI